MRNLLRLALKGGNFREILQLSREARALENLNKTGGIKAGSGPTQAQRGNYTNEMFLSDPDFAFNERYVDPFTSGNQTEYFGVLPDGRNMTMNPRTGTRTTTTPMGRGAYPVPTPPIQAPYEGFRVLPQGSRYDSGYGEYMGRGAPGPWMGRGRGTEWMELPFDGGPPYANGTYFEQYPGPRPLGGPPETRSDRPVFPWQMFADTGVPTPTRPIPSLFQRTYSFDDTTGASSFFDPQTGFRYGLNGFPLD